MSLGRRAVAEFLGTAFLLAIVVGSGIMGERLSDGNAAIALLANSISTGAGLIVLIATFGPISGAHFNPIVSLASVSTGGMTWQHVPAYLCAQFFGAFAGVAAAHMMFGEPVFMVSQHERSGGAQLWSEAVATFGLVFVIWSCARHRIDVVPLAVGGYITAAYWFTASTSFANPAVTLARAVTDTFSGIRPQDAPGFVLARSWREEQPPLQFSVGSYLPLKPCPIQSYRNLQTSRPSTDRAGRWLCINSQLPLPCASLHPGGLS